MSQTAYDSLPTRRKRRDERRNSCLITKINWFSYEKGLILHIWSYLELMNGNLITNKLNENNI